VTPRPDERLAPWTGPVLTTALAIGLVLMALQLWLLTVALDLYLGGRTDGFLVLGLLRGRPRP
jgi:hypothetical protein